MINFTDYRADQGYRVTQREEFISNAPVRSTWMYEQGKEFKCHGRERNAICVYGVEDLPLVMNYSRQGLLIANKFMTEVDFSVIPCLNLMLSNNKA